jgi:FixJ family two-component response regulator
MTMPNMTGEETLERLRAISANVPVLLASGFSEVEVSRRFGTGAISGFLQKPFTPSTLAAKIRDILAPGS